MTAIVGVVRDGSVYIGSDSASSDGWCEDVRADSKVFHNGPYLFGFTTSFRMGQLLHHALTPPEPTGDLDRFMATTFIDSVRDCLKTGGWAEKTNERERGGEFLVGVAGRLFTVHQDYQIAEPAAGHTAVGSGYLVALGSLYSTGQTRMPPRRRVLTALQAAERYTAGVRAPFICLRLGAPPMTSEVSITGDTRSTRDRGLGGGHHWGNRAVPTTPPHVTLTGESPTRQRGPTRPYRRHAAPTTD